LGGEGENRLTCGSVARKLQGQYECNNDSADSMEVPVFDLIMTARTMAGTRAMRNWRSGYLRRGISETEGWW